MNNSRSSYYLTDNHVDFLYLDAYSIGVSADLRVKKQGKIGIIHSIFQRVINITVSENRLISIVGQEVGQGPLNILLNIPIKLNLTTIGVKIGDIVTRIGGLIIIGENLIKISISDVKLWKPNIDYQDNLQPLESILSNIDVLKDVTLTSGPLNGLGELIFFSQIDGFNVSKTTKLGPVAFFASPYIVSLLKAIKSRCSQDIIKSTKNIVGLGPGLTPAGDDMLIGLMISMFYISANFKETKYDVNQINKDIVSSISGRTTILSEEFIHEASIGNSNEAVVTLIENLLISGPKELKISAKRILDLGATSGSDTVFGIILGFHLLLKDLYL